MPKDTPTSFFADAAAIANPAYLLREVSWEEARRAAHGKTQVRGVSFGGMGAEPYRAPSQAELIARAAAAASSQAGYDASQVAKARAALDEADALVLHLAGVLSACRNSISRAENSISEVTATRATEAATVADTLVDAVGKLYAAVRIARAK